MIDSHSTIKTPFGTDLSRVVTDQHLPESVNRLCDRVSSAYANGGLLKKIGLMTLGIIAGIGLSIATFFATKFAAILLFKIIFSAIIPLIHKSLIAVGYVATGFILLLILGKIGIYLLGIAARLCDGVFHLNQDKKNIDALGGKEAFDALPLLKWTDRPKDFKWTPESVKYEPISKVVDVNYYWNYTYFIFCLQKVEHPEIKKVAMLNFNEKWPGYLRIRDTREGLLEDDIWKKNDNVDDDNVDLVAKLVAKEAVNGWKLVEKPQMPALDTKEEVKTENKEEKKEAVNQ